MILLHTADLHLGKSLHESSLLNDQKYMLDKLRDELERESCTVLIISGDIYDRTVPPAEAVELFSEFLSAIRGELPELTVCIIPGNHDSAARLSFADRILKHQHIHIICNPEESFNPVIITAKNGERLALFLLPFLAAGTLEKAGRGPDLLLHAEGELDFNDTDIPFLASQAELAAEASRRFEKRLGESDLAGIPSVLVAHLFTLAGKQSESERLFLGTAEQVSPALFSRFAYVALGHLHRFQKITPRMYYPGSPLAYAFDEAGTDKVFLKVEIEYTSPDFPVTVTPLPVTPLRRVSRLSGTFAEFYTGTAFDAYAGDYVEISLTDSVLTANPINLLKPKFPFLLSLKQGLADASGTGGISADSGELPGDRLNLQRDPADDFCRFEELLYGTVDTEKKELFMSLLAECTDETR